MNGYNRGRGPFKIAILWRGDIEARRGATPQLTNTGLVQIADDFITFRYSADRVV